MEIMPKAWRPCQGHGDHAKGIGTMPKAWGSCQRHGDHAKCMKMTMTMVTMKTLRPQKLGEQDGQDYFFASREKMQVGTI